MSVIICIKRRLHDEPLPNFCPNIKRQRLDPNNGVFQFLGTKSESKASNIEDFFYETKSAEANPGNEKSANNFELSKRFPQSSRNLIVRNVQKRPISKDDDLNCSQEAAAPPKSIHLIDLEDFDEEEVITVNGQPMHRIQSSDTAVSVDQSQFVYDYYRGEWTEEDELEEGAALNICFDEDYGAEFGGELLGYRSIHVDSDESSDDSNCENYYRNDYPDEWSNSDKDEEEDDSSYCAASDKEDDDFIDYFDRNIF